MVDGIKFYADELCTVQIDTISWDQEINIKLVTGEPIVLPNAVLAGSIATATFYIRNESKSRYAVTALLFPDERVEIDIEQALLKPMIPIKLQIKFKVPTKPDPKNIIKAGKIEIKGYYIYGE